MKKILIFLITILCITLFPTKEVNAYTTSFYEGEYIRGIWMNKVKNGTKYYQTARFFRQSGTNNFAYCIEPFEMFNENSMYESTLSPNNLNEYQKQRISLIAHFGYGYKNHNDEKWYAITQMMIWKEADPTGNYYFSDKLNGNKIIIYENEMNEINNIIQNYLITPSIANNEYNIVEGQSITLTDTTNTLNNYKLVNNLNNQVEIINNNLNIKSLKEGTYNIELIRNDNIFNRPLIFFQGNNTQNLVEAGDIEKNTKLTIKVKKTEIEINKIDSDTKTNIPSGEGQIENTTYELLDHNKNKIQDIVINKNGKCIIKNIQYGKYYIKETKPGIGYTLDENIYEIELTKDQNIQKLFLENKIIKKEIEIIKEFGDGITNNYEEDILFEIYDKNNTLIATIKTNKDGKATIILPFGKYKIKQVNSSEGYKKVEDFEINVEDTKKETIKLYDYKIKVPNTSIDNQNINKELILILLGVINIIYVKKRIYN